MENLAKKNRKRLRSRRKRRYDAKPATIALNELAGTMAAEFNVQMAGSIILALPVLLLYIFMGKYLIRGYMAGAVTAT